eukprot:1149563-Pelagomonas_calceolata.AAC.3
MDIKGDLNCCAATESFLHQVLLPLLFSTSKHAASDVLGQIQIFPYSVTVLLASATSRMMGRHVTEPCSKGKEGICKEGAPDRFLVAGVEKDALYRWEPLGGSFFNARSQTASVHVKSKAKAVGARMHLFAGFLIEASTIPELAKKKFRKGRKMKEQTVQAGSSRASWFQPCALREGNITSKVLRSTGLAQ